MNQNLTRKSLLLLGAVLLFSSCNKDDAEEPGTTIGPVISNPTTITTSTEIATIVSDGEESSFTYDAEGRLAKVVSEYSYEDGEYLYESSSTSTLVYADGKLVQINAVDTYKETANGKELYSGTDNSTAKYMYTADNKLSKIENTYTWEEGTDNWTMNFAYTGDGLLEKAYETYDGISDDLIMFQWSGQNVVKEQWWGSDTSAGKRLISPRQRPALRHSKLSGYAQRSSQADVLEEEQLLSNFDDKQNPFGVLFVLYGYPEGWLISKNNPGKMVEYYIDEQGNKVEDDTQVFTYTYDSKGRPTKAVIKETDSDGYSETSEYIITYKN